MNIRAEILQCKSCRPRVVELEWVGW